MSALVLQALRGLFLPPVDVEADKALRQREAAAERARDGGLGHMKRVRLLYDTRPTSTKASTTGAIGAKIDADDAVMQEAFGNECP